MAAPAWEAYRRVGGIAPQNKFWVLGSLKCYFLHFGGIILQNSEDYTASSNSCTTAVVSGRYLDDCATEVPGSNRINCDRKYRYELIMSEQRREKILGWRSPKQNRHFHWFSRATLSPVPKRNARFTRFHENSVLFSAQFSCQEFCWCAVVISYANASQL